MMDQDPFEQIARNCPPEDTSAAPASLESAGGPDQVQFATASRYRVYDREAERVLRPGIAPEKGLQVKTILVARSVSVTFLGVDPRWDDLRDLPAFQDVLSSANLLDVSNRVRR